AGLSRTVSPRPPRRCSAPVSTTAMTSASLTRLSCLRAPVKVVTSAKSSSHSRLRGGGAAGRRVTCSPRARGKTPRALCEPGAPQVGRDDDALGTEEGFEDGSEHGGAVGSGAGPTGGAPEGSGRPSEATSRKRPRCRAAPRPVVLPAEGSLLDAHVAQVFEVA